MATSTPLISLGTGATERLDQLPPVLRQDVNISITRDVAGFDASAFIGQGTLKFEGGFTTSSVTGYATGTAGAGTTTTSLVKPAGGTNWTASALVGKLVHITSGGGEGETRPIRANTTTTITIDAIVGLDTTSVFQICMPSYAVTSDVNIENCYAPVVLKGLTISADINTSENHKVTFDSCVISGGDWLSTYDGRCILKNCLITGTHKFYAANTYRAVEVEACVLVDGQVKVEDCPYVSVQAYASDCAANALYLSSVGHAQVDMLAENNDVTPFWFEACRYLEAIGTDKLTGTGNTGYGISINTTGLYRMIGCTVTGSTNDIDFDGDVVTWANLASSTYGVYWKFGMCLIGEAGENKAVNPRAMTLVETIETYGRFLSGGYFNKSQATGLTAAGSTAGDALQLSIYDFNRVDTVAAGTGVRLTDGAVLPGLECIIFNNGANTLTVYPYTGGTIDGASSVTIAAGSAKTFHTSSNDGLSWVTTGAP